MSDRINGADNRFSAVNVNNDAGNQVQGHNRNSAPNQDVNSLAGAVKEQNNAVNNQLQNNNEDVLANLPNDLFEDGDVPQRNFSLKNPLDSAEILNKAKSLNGENQQISGMDDALFITGFIKQNQGFDVLSYTALACPNLAKLQDLASQCDLEFKITCAKHFKEMSPIKQLRVLYNASKNDAQRAYVDLLIAHTFCYAFSKDILAKLPENKRDPNIEQSLQALIGNLMAASSSEDIAKAVSELYSTANDLLKDVPNQFAQKALELLQRFTTAICNNKEAANTKVNKLADSFRQAAENISKVDPESLKANKSLFVTNNRTGTIPKQCGIVANYLFNESKSMEYISFNAHKAIVDKLLSEKDELDRIFKDPNLNGYTLEQIKNRIRTEGFNNEYLLAQLSRYEEKAVSDINSRIEVLFANPGKNDAFANELLSIFSSINRDITSEKASEVLQTLKDKFSAFDANAHEGFNDSLNFKTLKALIIRAPDSDALKSNFSEVIRLVANNKFSFLGFSGLNAPANATEAVKIESAVSFLESYAAALSDPQRAKTLLNEKIDKALTDGNTRLAFFKMATALARNTDSPAVKQQCGYMKNLLAVKESVNQIVAQITTAAKIDFGANTVEVVNLLVKIGTGSANNITSGDLKKLLAFTINIPLKELNAIWNTVLYSAYHLNMKELIESNAIADAPARVYSTAAEENAAGANVPNPGEQARQNFIASLDANVRAKLGGTMSGALREKGQLSTVSNIASSLNAKLDDKKALQTVLVASDKGKSLLSLEEMRKDVYTFGTSWSSDAYKNISDPDELIKIGINKNKLADEVNRNHKIADNFINLQKSHDVAIGMPTISALLSAQKLGPKDSVKGEDVAVSISLLRDNLIDDASLLDDATLAAYGISNRQLITFTKDEMTFAKDYAEYLVHQSQYQALNLDFEPDPRFSDENVNAFKTKCQNALSKLEEALTTQVNVEPLSKVTKLLINKYMQISGLLNAHTIATFEVSQLYLNNHNILDAALQSPDEVKRINLEITARAHAKQNEYFDAIINGKMNTQTEFLNHLVSDFSSKVAVYEYDKIENISNVTKEVPLTSAEKKELISNLKILNQNIDVKTFTQVPEDPVNGKTSFSADLLELSNAADDVVFTRKLNAFIGNHLKLETTTVADSVVVYKSYENRTSENAATTSISTALSDAAVNAAAGTNLNKIVSSYKSGYGNTARNREALDLDTKLTKSESESLRPLSNELLSRSDVRDVLRLASSYAATKLGYAGKNALYEAYKKSDTPAAEKAKIENMMVHCLKVRGFDSNLAKLLAKARLSETSDQFILTKMFRSVKSHFFSIVNDIKGVFRSAKIFFGGLPADEAEKRAHDFHEYLPAMKETVSRIGENEIRYVTQDMNFKVSFNALAAIDAVTGGALDKNDILKVKASLTLGSNAAMMIGRNPDGKVSMFINASILQVGLEVEASGKPAIAGGAKGSAGVSAGGNRILELKFDTDDEAAAFMCKMYTAQLTEEDVRLASEAASGSSFNASGKVQVKATMSKVLQGFLHHDDLDAINNEKDDAAKNALVEKYAKEHPIIKNIVDYTNIGAVDLSYKFNFQRSNVIDNSGSTVEYRTEHTIGKKIKLFDLASGSHKPDISKLDKGADQVFKDIVNVKDGTDVVTDIIVSTTANALNKSDPKKAKKFVDAVDSLSKKIDKYNQYNNDIYHIEHISSKHYSATTGNIDAATEKTVSNKLTKNDLELMEEKGLINDTVKAKLQELIEKEKIVKVTFVRTLKQSVIDTYKDDKAKLEKEAGKVNSNFTLQDVIIETKGGESSTIKNEDWLSIVSGGYASYTTENKSNSNYVLKISATSL
ncbi:hypothetical protein [Succinivibrio dextrinosolvens]|uniref:hypothetical protein n=1 Tax=Succinivibrio dextrinosolvens TaxID=83771 RepID=UPI00241F26BF|nr:hypothetical protein [Succinivibrio dextrinosolvens]MBE6422430.1 hypothetical protein [Succinivibrio dextrinosolvens]